MGFARGRGSASGLRLRGCSLLGARWAALRWAEGRGRVDECGEELAVRDDVVGVVDEPHYCVRDLGHAPPHRCGCGEEWV